LKRLVRDFISTWEKRCYPNGLSDFAPRCLEKMCGVPSYRVIALAILKNDVTMKSLGFTPPPSRVYSQIKRAEIRARGTSNQYELFL
jgi:predicted phosphoadenosine phosphosulfate sulfurtransferase